MLMTLGIALNTLAGVLFAVPVVGYVFGPAKRKEMKKALEWITLGSLTQFPEGETRLATYRNPFLRPWDGDTSNIPCWVRRISADKLQVFAINCAHLGCPVRWYAQSGLFLCPCHGGAYYADGSRASGPPPRGLFEYDYRIENGELWIKAGQMPTLASPPSQACADQPKRCSCA
ncbi:MAG TPA: Rieske 2Fe-2S domain-containing protein [Verrucomicrobiae bacterium]|nr:Rieske 2Fe-2S domain-containing protein [Verrucomicrobiae bacterium]